MMHPAFRDKLRTLFLRHSWLPMFLLSFLLVRFLGGPAPVAAPSAESPEAAAPVAGRVVVGIGEPAEASRFAPLDMGVILPHDLPVSVDQLAPFCVPPRMEIRELVDGAPARVLSAMDASPAPKSPAEHTAWIRPHAREDGGPDMPRIEARIPPCEPALAGDVSWRLCVEYRRTSGPSADTDTVVVPASGWQVLPAGEPWAVWRHPDWIARVKRDGFFGGDARIDVFHPLTGTMTFRFCIGGLNPDDTACRARLMREAGHPSADWLWFAPAVARHETQDINGMGSRYNQFLDAATSPDRAGMPVGKAGYGLFQITGDPVRRHAPTPTRLLWNWEENLVQGVGILRDKRRMAVRWMARQREEADACSTPLPVLKVGGVYFGDGTTHTMEDAVAIKLFNGGSLAPSTWVDAGPMPAGFRLSPQDSGHYCFWDSEARAWAINRYNSPYGRVAPFDYVARVCAEVEEAERTGKPCE